MIMVSMGTAEIKNTTATLSAHRVCPYAAAGRYFSFIYQIAEVNDSSTHKEDVLLIWQYPKYICMEY